MKTRKSRPPKTQPDSTLQIAVWFVGMAVILVVLIAAFVELRPILMNQIQSSQTDLGKITASTPGSSQPAPTETAAGIGDRLSGDLDALPASAFARGRTITIGVSDAFGQINPLYGGGDADQDAVALIFEPILRLNAEGQPEGVLAETITPDLAGRTVSIRLRADHIWRDGRSVNASDVVFTYRCLLSPAYDGPLAGRFDDLAAVAAGPKTDGRETVVFTFKPGGQDFDYSLLTVGILKSDYYAVPVERVYEMGRKRLPPEGSGAFQWLETLEDRRVLTLRQGYAGDVQQIEQVLVGPDDKYPMLQAGALDIVRHDWSERIESRVARLPAYAYFDAFRIDQYLLTAPEPEKQDVKADSPAIAALLRTAAGQSALPLTSAGPLTLAYFRGIEDTVSQQQAANAELIRRRLELAGQPVNLQPLSWPELADRASLGTFQLLLLPAASDNRLPARTVLKAARDDRPVNAIVAFQHPQILLVSARLEGLKVNPNGAPFSASPLTFTDEIASVRILDPDGLPLTNG